MKPKQWTEADWDMYVAWQIEANKQIHEIGPPPPRPKTPAWVMVMSVIYCVAMVLGIGWVFVMKSPILGATWAAVFWCQARESQ